MFTLDPSSLIGKKYHRLTIKEYIKGHKNKKSKCVFLCDCGKTIIAGKHDVVSGHTKSCGCYNIENIHKKKTHGFTCGKKRPNEYMIWASMKQRCLNPRNADYKYYGGRGITVSKEWNDYSVFIKDMGKRPSTFHTIERIDNEKGYCKENCKWVTKLEQARNKRNIVITEEIRMNITKLKKKGMGITDASRYLGLKRSTIGSVWYSNEF